MVRGDRIYLRAIETTDTEACYRWLNDPEVTQYILSGKWPMSRPAEQSWVDRAARGENPNDRSLAICLIDGDRHIGNLGLGRIDWHSRTCILGILIGEKDCWGQGYGTDAVRTLLGFAFRRLNLRKVSLSVLDFNTRGIRCYEKCGFVREGVQRAQYFKDGRYVDDILMAVFAPGQEPSSQ